MKKILDILITVLECIKAISVNPLPHHSPFSSIVIIISLVKQKVLPPLELQMFYTTILFFLFQYLWPIYYFMTDLISFRFFRVFVALWTNINVYAWSFIFIPHSLIGITQRSLINEKWYICSHYDYSIYIIQQPIYYH